MVLRIHVLVLYLLCVYAQNYSNNNIRTLATCFFCLWLAWNKHVCVLCCIKSKYAHIAFTTSETLALRGCVNTKYDVIGPDIQTSTGRLGLIPLRIVGVHTFNGNGPLFQSIPGITSKLHHSTHSPCVVTTGQVTVLHEGFVAVACCKGCGRKTLSVEWWLLSNSR